MISSGFTRVVFAAAALVVSGTALSYCASSEIRSFEQNANGATLYAESGALRIAVCSDRIVHVVASPVREIPVAIVPAVIGECNDREFKIESNKSTISVRTTALEVSVDRATGVVRFLTSDGKTILSEPASGGRRLTPQSIQGVSTFQVQQAFLSPEDEALYGLGQHQEGIFNLRELPLRLQQANTNISIPVLLSTKGYGLLWNNASLTDFNAADEPITLDAATGEGTFRTGAAGEYGFLLIGNRTSKLRLSVDDKAIIDIDNMWVADSASGKISLKANTEYRVSAQTGGNTKLFVRPPSATTEFRSEAGGAVDYYFFYGPELNQVIAEYRQMTGAAPLLPRWAYGFWQCRERYSNQRQILDTAAEFRARKIPVDVIVQDWQYWGKYGWNALRFDEQYYPDPAQLMTQLHKEDLHLVASVWAKFGTETTVDQDMKKEHLLLSVNGPREPGEAQAKEDWVDLFNPKAQEMFWSELDRGLFHDGLDGWWLDASEPEGDPLKGSPTFLGPGELVRNAYPLYETTAVYNGQRAADHRKRVVILTRSAFTGQQRNGTISWSGDISANWETLRRQIPAGLSFGMSGMPYWTTDIGGFFRPRDQYTSDAYHELLIRWFQFGAFSPIFRVHGYQSETEIWKYGPQVEGILKEFDELRYRLLPYTYSTAWGVTKRGATMMKALPFVYPSVDQSLREVSDQFLFGDSLLINPVTEPNVTTRRVVLPAGSDWFDFWSGQKYHGGQTMVADAPLDKMPILVREGSIVPLGPNIQYAAESQDPIELRIYGGKDADFQLYEDSGDGYAYEAWGTSDDKPALE